MAALGLMDVSLRPDDDGLGVHSVSLDSDLFPLMGEAVVVTGIAGRVVISTWVVLIKVINSASSSFTWHSDTSPGKEFELVSMLISKI